MPYKDPEKYKSVKRKNYVKNKERIKARIKRNYWLKKSMRESNAYIATERAIKAQQALIAKVRLRDCPVDPVPVLTPEQIKDRQIAFLCAKGVW